MTGFILREQMRKGYLEEQSRGWLWRGLVMVLLFDGSEVYATDTATLAQTAWVRKAGAKALPQGVEVIHHYWAGETLYARIRFWEAAPPARRWYWEGETLFTTVQIPPLPPDSVMPQGDFSIPSRPIEAYAQESDSLWWLWAVMIALVLGLGLFPFLKKPLFAWAARGYGIARFYLWLWRWRKPDPARFEDFIRAVKELLRHHAPFHPGSLTLSELSAIQAPPALSNALKKLWEADYALSFEQKSLPASQKVAVWQTVWESLRQSGAKLSLSWK